MSDSRGRFAKRLPSHSLEGIWIPSIWIGPWYSLLIWHFQNLRCVVIPWRPLPLLKSIYECPPIHLGGHLPVLNSKTGATSDNVLHIRQFWRRTQWRLCRFGILQAQHQEDITTSRLWSHIQGQSLSVLSFHQTWLKLYRFISHIAPFQ